MIESGPVGSPIDPEAIQRQVLPLIEEQLHITKKSVDTGGIRLSKVVTTSEETADLPLIASEVVVERHEIGVLVLGDDVPVTRTEGDVTVYPVLKEVLVTQKRLLLVAEIRVRRVEVTHHEPQTVSLRKEDIVIARMDGTLIPSSK